MYGNADVKNLKEHAALEGKWIAKGSRAVAAAGNRPPDHTCNSPTDHEGGTAILVAVPVPLDADRSEVSDDQEVVTLSNLHIT